MPLAGAPTCVLVHALGCDMRMWDPIARRLLSQGIPVLRYDLPGHGQSLNVPSPDSLAVMADEAAALIQSQGPSPIIWIGLSMGGMIGQELALRHPGLVRALVLANTTSGYPASAQEAWTQRIDAIRRGGLKAVVDLALSRWFHEEFRLANPTLVSHWRDRILRCSPEAYIACCEAIRRIDTTARLAHIQQQCLVIAGSLDAATPPEMSQVLADKLPNARFVTLDGASHLSAIEQPDSFFSAVNGWLLSLLARP